MTSISLSDSSSDQCKPVRQVVHKKVRKALSRRVAKSLPKIKALAAQTEGVSSLNTDVIYQTLRLYKHTIRVGVLRAQQHMLSIPSRQMLSDWVDKANSILLGLVRLSSFALDARECLTQLTLMAWNEYHRNKFSKCIEYCELVSQVNKSYGHEREEIEALKLNA